jgi:hypothetical protein
LVVDARNGAFLTGVDPGRDKFGFAFADENGRLLASGIGRTKEAGSFFRLLRDGRFGELRPLLLEGTADGLGVLRLPVICGAGTGHAVLAAAAKAEGLFVRLVPESGTTLQARSLYWSLHPPGGLWRAVPVSMRVPPRDIDDLAAWAIVKESMQRAAETPAGMGDTEHGS